ncbi:unnamed protein product [Notodromas monacha]|uniref:Vacuolar protein-sorting-associated protein 36 n=1 Tax=Notodromas monacha TaxID=399045 RepID=A0A7R9GBZ5_9CRUS|nr:unnamed protein product [Notodromas monacha]CAG0915563.1 unnamed protein product [Notodromas monacha]
MTFDLEDLVLKAKKKRVAIGIISETYVDSAEYDDEDEDIQKLKAGQCRVAWLPRGVETIEDEAKLVLGDKSMMPSDTVEKVSSPGRKGTVLRVGVTASVRPLIPYASQSLSSGWVILNVPDDRLNPLLDFAEGIVVSYESCFGTISRVSVRVYAKVNCSWDVKNVERRCWIPESIALDMEEIGGGNEDDEEYELEMCPFRPGQHLTGSFKQLMENATWLTAPPPPPTANASKTSFATRKRVFRSRETHLMVYDVCVDYVSVSWNTDDGRVPPPPRISGELLKKLKKTHVNEQSAVHAGILRRYVVKADDVIIPADEWNKSLRQKFPPRASDVIGDVENKCDEDSPSEPAPEPPPQASGETRRDDDSSEWVTEDAIEDDEELDSEEIKSPSKNRGKRHAKPCKRHGFTKQHKMFSGREVPKPKSGDELVVETVFTETEVDVKWQDTEIERNLMSNDLTAVQHLDEHELFPGDFVQPAEGFQAPGHYGYVLSVDHAERTAKVVWYENLDSDNPGEAKEVSREEVSVYDIVENQVLRLTLGTVVMIPREGNEEPSVGQITELRDDGKVSVQWIDKSVTDQWPYELKRIGDYDSDEGGLWSAGADISSSLSSSSENLEKMDDGDDSWCTASDTSEDRDEQFSADVDDGGSGSSFYPISKHPGLMDLDYKGTKEENPSYKVFKNKFVRKVVAMERVRDRIWTMVSQHPKDANPDAYNGLPLLDLPKVCRDCLLLDEIMGQKTFSQREINWRPFTELRKHFDRNTLEGFADGAPELINFIACADALEGKPNMKGHVPENAMIIDLNRISKNRVRAGVVKVFGESMRAHDPIWVQFAEDGTPVIPSEASKTGNITAAVFPGLPSKVKCILMAWLRERLFQASYHIVTHFDSNNIMDADEFFPVASLKDDNLVLDEDAEPEAAGEAEPESPSGVMEESEPVSASPQVLVERGSFEVIETLPDSHKYAASVANADGPSFSRAVMREMKLLKTSLPKGIHVRAFEDRRDVLSAVIEGPSGTPYEGGLFFFDCQLPPDYPSSPPRVTYISYVTDRLNPNLYEEGKVCVSLLGTWDGRGSELWSKDSSLLQVLVSIQGLILNKEPYYNEAGYEKQRGERLAAENSRKYNEMAVMKVVQAMARLTEQGLPSIFENEVKEFLRKHGHPTIKRINKWVSAGELAEDGPDFPLLPLSKGCVLCIERALSSYAQGLRAIRIRLVNVCLDQFLFFQTNMGRQRGKKVKVQKACAEQEDESIMKAPHSFVIHRGQVSQHVECLVRDIRKIFEPFTASQLKVKKSNSIKDFLQIAGIFSVNAMTILSQTERGVNMKIGRIPRGPSVTFRVKEYALARDVRSSIKRPLVYERLDMFPPLLVLSGFGAGGDKNHLLLISKIFQGMFPTINVTNVELKKILRVALVHYDHEENVITLRHYAIKVVPVASRAVKKLVSNRVPDLSKYQDVEDFVARCGMLSESEGEDDPEAHVELAQEVNQRGNVPAQKSSIRLIELGPRLKLEVMKIEEDLFKGEILYHSIVTKSPEERERIRLGREEKKRLKDERKRLQEENIRNKLAQEKTEDNVPADADEDDDNDKEWFKKEVGAEPDAELFPLQQSGSRKRKTDNEDPEARMKKRKEEEKKRRIEFEKKMKKLKAKKKHRQLVGSKRHKKNSRAPKKERNRIDFMDRFEWCDAVLKLDEKLVAKQVDVKLYDGEQATTFEKGEAVLTPYRLLWRSPGQHKGLALNLNLVVFVDDESATFSKSAKIVLHLARAPAGKEPGPVEQSGFSHVKLSIKQSTGAASFSVKLKEVLATGAWTSNNVISQVRGSSQPRSGAVGILGIERSIEARHAQTDKNISKAFQDLKVLMTMASEMVNLSKSISQKMRDRKGCVSEDETVEFKSALLRLGVSNSVISDAGAKTGSEYSRGLAKEMCVILTKPLEDSKGIMPLTDAYCVMNRARSLAGLVSPEDFLAACEQLRDATRTSANPLVFKAYHSGLKCVQWARLDNDDVVIDDTMKHFASEKFITAEHLAKILGISVVLAQQRLVLCEEKALACRDDSAEGLRFYPNRFLYP